jgi:hypothetical protein
MIVKIKCDGPWCEEICLFPANISSKERLHKIAEADWSARLLDSNDLIENFCPFCLGKNENAS